jgi:hypothetical protein
MQIFGVSESHGNHVENIANDGCLMAAKGSAGPGDSKR